jgi:anti-sigma regulatory factor (Ser/Thr protein kinase)
VIRFEDGGVPFNPLEHKMPNTKLSWKLRSIGGLGIFLVLKKMDHVSYDFVDQKNVLTIEKAVKDNQ